MVSLNDQIWKTVEGGYKILYDASIPLKLLQEYHQSDKQEKILDELFEELHHQGDVGLASYLAVPHLISIGIEHKITDWKLIGLVTTIEIARHSDHNPQLPSEYETFYFESLNRIQDLVKLNSDWNRTYTCCALSALAAAKGQIDMAKVILELESSDLTEKFNEFLENY